MQRFLLKRFLPELQVRRLTCRTLRAAGALKTNRRRQSEQKSLNIEDEFKVSIK